MMYCLALVLLALSLTGTNADGKTESLEDRTRIKPNDQSRPSPSRERKPDHNHGMFPFGPAAGDTLMGTTDDGCQKFTFGTPIKYFGSSYTKMWVCNNGIVTFDGVVWWYTPRPMSHPAQNKRIIAAYWADIDTRFGIGEVFYGKRTSATDLQRGKKLVEKALQGIPNFNPTIVIVITWYRCTFFGANSQGRQKLNTFQLVIVSDGPRTFAFKIYDRLQWTTGTASGGNPSTGLGGTEAAMGFSNRFASNQWYQVPGYSFTPNALDMTKVTNIQGPFVPGWTGCWLDQYNLIGTLAPIMDCLRKQRCCVMQGNRYQPAPIPGCTKFFQWDYLNSTPWPTPQPCAPGTLFDVFPTICTGNHIGNVNSNTCSSNL